MNYRIIDVDNSLIEEGRNLTQLKRHYANAVQQSVHASHSEQRTKLEKHNITNWDFGDLADSVEYQHQGMTVLAFPMLRIQEDQSISLLIHDQDSIARYHTKRACLALAKRVLTETTQKQTLKYLQKELLANKQRTQKKSNGGLGALAEQLKSVTPQASEKSEWLDEVIDAALCAACFANGLDDVRTQSKFQQALSSGAKQWVAIAMDIETTLVSCLRQRDQLLRSVNQINATSVEVDSALEDIKSQLYRLFEPSFLRYTPLSQLKQYPRYLRAIEARLEKLGKPHSQDAALKKLQRLYDEKIIELQVAELQLDYAYSLQPKLAEYARMLEEFRVSIFAQHLKTQMPVSEKRLKAFWATINS